MFNCTKVARLEAEAKAATQVMEVSKELSERLIADKDRQIADLRDEVSNLRAKVSLMETVMMPLSSHAGAMYQEKLHPRNETIRPLVEAPVSEWQRYKRQKEKELEESYLAEDAKSVEKN
jgi:hypothetical protein